MAVSFAMAFLLVIFSSLLAFTTLLTATSLRVDDAVAATQALYSAEAGVEVLLQTGAADTRGQCGRGAFVAAAQGGRLVALGQVELPSGAHVRRAVAVDRGAPAGSWRLLPPAQQTDLIARLAAAGPEVAP
jgi:hypothetical protein